MAHSDEAIDALLEKHGAAGYGVYWLILEEIASAMDAGRTEPEAVHSLASWADLAHIPWQKMRMILGSLSDHLAIISRCDDDRIRISVPNILKYRDEHKRKSPHVPPLNAPKSRVEESRVEVSAAAAPIGTIVEGPAAEVPAAAAVAAEFPQSSRLIRESFPGTDGQLIRHIVQRALERKADAEDAELSEALIRTHKGNRQRSAALWLQTVPAFFASRDGPAPPAVCPECGGHGQILSHEYASQPNSAWIDLPEARTHVPCPRCRGDTLRKPAESELRELVYASAKGAS